MIKQSHFRRGLSRKPKRRTAARIFEEYKNALFHTARRMVASDGDAEDAVMLTMERICRHMELLETLSEPEVQSYLYKTVSSCVIDLHRANERQDHAFWLYAAEGALTEELPESDDFGETERYVAELPEKYRVLITLFYRDGYAIREISAMLKIPESTIGTRLSRAREMLRKRILSDREAADTALSHRGEADTKCGEEE